MHVMPLTPSRGPVCVTTGVAQAGVTNRQSSPWVGLEEVVTRSPYVTRGNSIVCLCPSCPCPSDVAAGSAFKASIFSISSCMSVLVLPRCHTSSSP